MLLSVKCFDNGIFKGENLRGIMDIVVNFKGRKIKLNVTETGPIRQGIGFTFRTRNTDCLLFDFKKEVYERGALTSFFVFFPFLALWLDKNNGVLEHKIIKPWILSILPSKPFRKVVEVPISPKNRKIIDFFVGK